jgi:hypothetical protein
MRRVPALSGAGVFEPETCYSSRRTGENKLSTYASEFFIGGF